jgi:hypothetical protein
LLHPPNPPRQVRRSFSFTDPAFRNNYIQYPNSSENTLEHFRELLRIQRRKKKKKKNNNNNKNNKKK